MVNTFMAQFYQDQAAATADAIAAQAELVLWYTTKLEASTPTPTKAEMDAIAGGTPTTLVGDGTPSTAARNILPPHRNVHLKRQYPTRV